MSLLLPRNWDFGIGQLDWPRGERVSDRYGVVGLYVPGGEFVNIKLDRIAEGTVGTLIAEVREVRDSPHLGDVFRKIYPCTPEVGTVLVLGVGAVFYQDVDGDEYIGLRPDPPRDFDWLDPHQLYRAHAQTVRLYLRVEQ